jgi:PST family polysaccharide transporter
MAIFLGVASSQYLVIENLQKINFYCPIIGLSFNVVLNIIFIPRYGVLGSAYATLISYWVSGILSNLLFEKSRVVFKYQVKSFLSFFTFRFLSSNKLTAL